MSKRNYEAHESIVIKFAGLPGNKNDWIGIYPKDSNNTGYLQYAITDGAVSGTMEFDGLNSGEYEARLFFNNTYTVEKVITFTVGVVNDEAFDGVYLEGHEDYSGRRQGPGPVFRGIMDSKTGKYTELDFKQKLPSRLKSGARVKVWGHKVRGLKLERLEVDRLVLYPELTKAAGQAITSGRRAVSLQLRSVLLVAVNLIDAKATATASQLQAMFFSSTPNINQAFRTASYGQLGLKLGNDSGENAVVTINLNVHASDYYGQGIALWQASLDYLRNNLRYNTDAYDHIVYVMPSSSVLGTGVAWSHTNAQTSVHYYFGPTIMMHELGHNIGFSHSGTDPHNTGVDSTDFQAYGDVSCTMGYGHLDNVVENFNASKKIQKGWLNAFSGTVSTASSNGSYTLYPLGVNPGTTPGQRVVSIPVKDGSYYYVSFRKSVDPYEHLNLGDNMVSVHRQYTPTSVSCLVATLSAGQVFRDATNNITVTCASIVSNTANVNVAVNGGTVYALKVNSGSGSGSYASGRQVTITANASPSGKVFSKWVVNSGSPTIANASAATTTLTMPTSAVTVTATYVNIAGPAGYTWCASEGASFTLPGTCDVAYGANGKFYYKYGVTGTITFNNDTFGDPIPGVKKAGFYKAATGVILYQHTNYGGAKTEPLAKGSYTLSQLRAKGFINDWASSCSIPSGWTVTLYKEDNFGGTSWTLNSSSSGKANFSTLSPSANDVVSSVRIQ